MTSREFVVLGGGLAGLTIAAELARAGRSVAVIEQSAQVGGLSRTVRRDGFAFDLGGHRFHSNNPDVVRWLHDLLGGDLLRVARRSRIRLNGRFIDYPIRLGEAMNAFGPRRGLSLAWSYLSALIAAGQAEAVTFEDWVVSRFGRGLYDVYFAPYTEKVWGIPGSELDAEWAEQRIGLPSLTQAALRALLPTRTPPATIVREFYYPRSGYGEICDRLCAAIVERGQAVSTATSVVRVSCRDDGAEVEVCGPADRRDVIACDRVISTIPVHGLLAALASEPDIEKLASETRLTYRGLLLILLALDRPRVSEDTWTYFPDPGLVFGRSHEPKNWSAAMAPARDVTSLALEVFCSPGDARWASSDASLVTQAIAQLEGLSWIRAGEVRAWWVVREPHAYPVYSLGYREQMNKVRAALRRWPRLSLLGRTGAFQYLNADGIVEACFELAATVGMSGGAVSRLPTNAGRWV